MKSKNWAVLENHFGKLFACQNDKQTRKITIKGKINWKRNARWFYLRFFLKPRKLIVIKKIRWRSGKLTTWTINWISKQSWAINGVIFQRHLWRSRKKGYTYKKNLMEKYKNVTDKNLRFTKLCLPHSGKPVKNCFTWGGPLAMVSDFFSLILADLKDWF